MEPCRRLGRRGREQSRFVPFPRPFIRHDVDELEQAGGHVEFVEFLKDLLEMYDTREKQLNGKKDAAGLQPQLDQIALQKKKINDILKAAGDDDVKYRTISAPF